MKTALGVNIPDPQYSLRTLSEDAASFAKETDTLAASVKAAVASAWMPPVKGKALSGTLATLTDVRTSLLATLADVTSTGEVGEGSARHKAGAKDAAKLYSIMGKQADAWKGLAKLASESGDDAFFSSVFRGSLSTLAKLAATFYMAAEALARTAAKTLEAVSKIPGPALLAGLAFVAIILAKKG